MQIPLKNIAGGRALLVEQNTHGKFIGAKLVNPRDKDTVISPTKRNYGDWDCRLLENSWPVPLEMICDWLEAKIGQSTDVDPTEHVRWER